MLLCWQKIVPRSLRKLFEEGVATDFTVICEGGGRIDCHVLILLGVGGLLKELTEKCLDEQRFELDLSETKIKVEKMREIISSFYCGLGPCVLKEENVSEFIGFSIDFDLQWLLDDIFRTFDSILTVNNVLKIMAKAQISSLATLLKKCEEFCKKNIEEIISSPCLDVSLLSKESLSTLLSFQSEQNIDQFILFQGVMKWALHSDENSKSAAQMLSMVSLEEISRDKLLSEVYNNLFNRLIIEKATCLTRDDKVVISSLYQNAMTSKNDEREDEKSTAKACGRVPRHEQREASFSESDDQVPISIGVDNGRSFYARNTRNYNILADQNDISLGQSYTSRTGGEPIQRNHQEASRGQESRGERGEPSILSHILSRTWQNMELYEVKQIVSSDSLPDSEFVVVEAILLWIANDVPRKQYAEDLLRCCRFSSLCPVYVRSVLTTFVTEKLLGSVRVCNNICRTPSVARVNTQTGRVAGWCDNLPLSIQRLTLGDHTITIKCQCGNKCQGTLHVSRTLPTATVKSFSCSSCGTQNIQHSACTATLTPDVFPSLHLLPFNHLAHFLSSMDDLRIYLFK